MGCLVRNAGRQAGTAAAAGSALQTACRPSLFRARACPVNPPAGGQRGCQRLVAAPPLLRLHCQLLLQGPAPARRVGECMGQAGGRLTGTLQSWAAAGESSSSSSSREHSNHRCVAACTWRPVQRLGMARHHLPSLAAAAAAPAPSSPPRQQQRRRRGRRCQGLAGQGQRRQAPGALLAGGRQLAGPPKSTSSCRPRRGSAGSAPLARPPPGPPAWEARWSRQAEKGGRPAQTAALQAAQGRHLQPQPRGSHSQSAPGGSAGGPAALCRPRPAAPPPAPRPAAPHCPLHGRGCKQCVKVACRTAGLLSTALLLYPEAAAAAAYQRWLPGCAALPPACPSRRRSARVTTCVGAAAGTGLHSSLESAALLCLQLP